MTEELLRNFEAASKLVKSATPGDKTAAGYEKKYGEAYNALVRAGLAMPLRKKYRI